MNLWLFNFSYLRDMDKKEKGIDDLFAGTLKDREN
jgi:hypothetical protein